MITSPPWRSSDEERGHVIVDLPAPQETRLIRPIFYCRQTAPRTDENIGPYHEPKSIIVRHIEDVYLLERHIVVAQDSSELLTQTFLRGKHKHHGGVFVSKETDEGTYYKPKTSYDVGNGIRFDRPIYFADTDKPNVFGHVLLEVLPRLWAASVLDEPLTIATSVALNNSYTAMFGALGIQRSSILKINRPIIARSVYFPSLPVVRRSWIHPEAWAVFDQLKRLADQSDITTHERIYISRSRVAGREMVNELEVEDFFLSKGFTIVHPQELPIQAQIKLFRDAKLVAGAGGSAMHNALFSSPKAKILILSSDRWVVNADMLLSQVPERLGYVIGDVINEDLSDEKKRVQSPWKIEMSQVREAVRHHFSLK